MTPQVSNQQVDWFEVYLFVAALLARTPSWPAAGTYEWVALPADDPRKLAAVLEAGTHWSLHIEAKQTAQTALSHDLSTDAEWIAAVATDVRNHPHHRIRRAS